MKEISKHWARKPLSLQALSGNEEPEHRFSEIDIHSVITEINGVKNKKIIDTAIWQVGKVGLSKWNTQKKSTSRALKYTLNKYQ